MELDPKWRSLLKTDQIVTLTLGMAWGDALAAYLSRDTYRAILFAPGLHQWDSNVMLDRTRGTESVDRPMIVGPLDPAQRPVITRGLKPNASKDETEKGGRALFNVVVPFVALTQLDTSLTGPVLHFRTHHHHASEMSIGSCQGGDVVTLHDKEHEGDVTIRYLRFGPSTNWLLDGAPYHGGAHKMYMMLGAGKQKGPIAISNCYGEDGTGYLVQAAGCQVTVRNCGAVNTRGLFSAHSGGEIDAEGCIYVRDDIPRTTLAPKADGEAVIVSGGGRAKLRKNVFYLQHSTATGPVHGLNVAYGDNVWYVLDGSVRAQWDNATSGADARMRFIDYQAYGALVGDTVRVQGAITVDARRAAAALSDPGVVPPNPTPEPLPEPPMEARYVSGSSNCTECKGTSKSDAPPSFNFAIPDPCNIYLRPGTTVVSDLWLEEGQTVTLSGWPGDGGIAEMAGNILTDFPARVKLDAGVIFTGSFLPVTEPEPPIPPEPVPTIGEDVAEIRALLDELVDMMRSVFNR